ncbi:hypothetical protein TSUD_183140 [Trifolium subterraneum]|uniref:Uncharacterized protein n=1 Tax=Trifolium subterraneum TaxID=3900 RepID=A0A2Z6NND4_TRISU|nr:hypothetical protein TSUD_183140 [Trifolium subterraneum]
MADLRWRWAELGRHGVNMSVAVLQKSKGSRKENEKWLITLSSLPRNTDKMCRNGTTRDTMSSP